MEVNQSASGAVHSIPSQLSRMRMCKQGFMWSGLVSIIYIYFIVAIHLYVTGITMVIVY